MRRLHSVLTRAKRCGGTPFTNQNKTTVRYSTSNFNFDRVIDRSSTDSMKWGYVKGTNQVPLWVADMCFECPPCVSEAVEERAKHHVYGYAMPWNGLYDSILGYLDRIGNPTKEASDIVLLPNVMIGVTLTANAFASEGDQVLCMTPVYPPFFIKPEANAREVVGVPLHEMNGKYEINFDAMEASVTNRTKVLFLCNPHNPVGRVFTLSELRELGDFCKKHDLIVCSDEIHCDLVMPDTPHPHIPFASISQDAADRTITLYSASKTYNVAGLTCAYATITNPSLRSSFMKQYETCLAQIDPNFFGYHALEAAYNHGESWRYELLSYLQGNRDFVHKFIAENMDREKVKLFRKNEATYLTWVDVSGLNLGKSPHRFFADHGVMLSPGRPFGGTSNTEKLKTYDQFVRINFATPRSTLEQGLRCMLAGYHAAIAT